MRRMLLCAALITLGAFAAQAQPAGQPTAKAAEPTIDDVRKAVATLKGNRIHTPTDYDTLTPEQKAYARSILTGPRSSITGPLGVMLVSPTLGDLSQKAMAYARFAGRDGFSTVPPKLNELAILIVAKHWSAEYVWNAHHSYGVRMGLDPALVEAIRTGAPPPKMDRDVQAVYDFATQFLATRKVSDATLQAAKAVLGGDRGVVDLVGTMGLYQISSMMVTVDETPVGDSEKTFFKH